MPTTFRYTQVDSISDWTNEHAAVRKRISLWTPDGLPTTEWNAPPRQVRSAIALNDILEHCLGASQPEPLRILGSCPSLSSLPEPGSTCLDLRALDWLKLVDPSMFTSVYAVHAARRGGRPVVVGGGTELRALSRWLGAANLALPTCGAGETGRLAGCIATGTHGSATDVGALHEAVLAIYLVTGPNQGVLIQPSQRRFTSSLAQWLNSFTTIRTSDVADDELFEAARVALGALGIVHSVIVEAVPLYELVGVQLSRPLDDPDLWHAIETLDTSRLDARSRPHDFAVALGPDVGSGKSEAFVSLLWRRAPSRSYEARPPSRSAIATDCGRIRSRLLELLDRSVGRELSERLVLDEVLAAYGSGPIGPLFPDQIYGPPTLPSGLGRGTEIVIDHVFAGDALRTILSALRSQAAVGRHLLAAVGVRFVPRTTALLGTNIHPMNMCIELPSLASPHVRAIHEACWAALRSMKIPFTSQWGQEHAMDAASLAAYFGDRIQRWKAARTRLLRTPAQRRVFSSPLAERLGLHG